MSSVQFYSAVSHQSYPSNPIAFDPNVADPTIRLRESLRLAGMAIHQLKPSEHGTVGKVKFVQFTNDPVEGRWFAVKRPLDTKGIFYDPKLHISLQKNCHKIASALEGHPNFMKVYGHVLKKDGKGNDKPYMIMEYIDGSSAKMRRDLTGEQNMNLLKQVKDAMLHMAKNKVDPGLGFCKPEFFLTKDYQFKLIDFDFWKKIEDLNALGKSQQIDFYSNCFHLGLAIARLLMGENFRVATDFYVEKRESPENALGRCLDELIKFNTSNF